MSSGESWQEWSNFGLAYLGDVIYELWCRQHALQRSQNAEQVHRWVVELVRCQTQARLAKFWWDHLKLEEQQVFQRGRNQKPQSRPKHATVEEYRQATGLECLIGYWHLQHSSRLDELMQLTTTQELLTRIWGETPK